MNLAMANIPNPTEIKAIAISHARICGKNIIATPNAINKRPGKNIRVLVGPL
jgi:hypothetical protein